MKHPAKVRFVGNREDYKRVKGEGQAIIFDQTVHFDEDGNALEEGPIACHQKTDSDPNDYIYCFTVGKLYPYFLEFWQGERISLHVKNDLGEITDFNDINDLKL